MVGGMVRKGGGVTDSPSNVDVPLVIYPVALLNGGSGGLCVVPVFGLGLAPCIVLLPFALFVPLVLFPFLFCFVLSCLLWVGSAVEKLCPAFPFSFPPFVFSVTALLV